MIPLAEINGMPVATFVERFGDVAEHSPWVAEGAAALRPYHAVTDMIAAFEATLHTAPVDAQLALIRAHPDLATKAKLTEDSNREQRNAGLADLTPSEFARFTDLNRRYKTRFGFPFIFAVKGATKHQILDSFEARVANSEDAEFSHALQHVMRIFRFRIEDRVAP